MRTPDVTEDRPRVAPRHHGAASRLAVVVVADPTVSTPAAAFLRQIGHDVREVGDATSAFELLNRTPADVVVVDAETLGPDAAELCKKTRLSDASHRYTYFVFVTRKKVREDFLAGVWAGADDFLSSPIDLDDLATRLHTATRVVALHRRLADHSPLAERHHLYTASRTDALTGLGNRMALHEALDALRHHAEPHGLPHALAICDVDMFKSYNERFGQEAGDAVLVGIAEVLCGNVPSSDVYRFGGEEFVLLFRDRSLDQASRIMERARAEVEALAIPAAKGGVVTISAGVTALDLRRDHDVDDWLSRADAALYGAKSTGPNHVEAMQAGDL